MLNLLTRSSLILISFFNYVIKNFIFQLIRIVYTSSVSDLWYCMLCCLVSQLFFLVESWIDLPLRSLISQVSLNFCKLLWSEKYIYVCLVYSRTICTLGLYIKFSTKVWFQYGFCNFSYCFIKFQYIISI